MKAVTVRDFYENTKLVDALSDGTQLFVTSHGKLKFVVTKIGHPRMTSKLAKERAVDDASKQVDATAFLRSLKK